MWRYIVENYEYHFPVTPPAWQTEPKAHALFWRFCKLGSALGFLRVDDGGFYRDARWTWAFWKPHRFVVGTGETLEVGWREYLGGCWLGERWFGWRYLLTGDPRIR